MLKLTLLFLAVCYGASTDNLTFAQEGEACGGFDESKGEPFPLCAEGFWCKPSEQASIPGTGNICVKQLAREGETCEGFNENTGAPFAKCVDGLVCKPSDQISIPGAGNVCVQEASQPSCADNDMCCPKNFACMVPDFGSPEDRACIGPDDGIVPAIKCAEPASSPTDGCRAPGDIFEGVSCNSCCEQQVTECMEKSGDDWYNSARTLSGECPELCPKCAPCTIREEETLLSLTPPASCNPAECATMDVGVDPCFAMGSCECFCNTANHLLRTCPQAKPDWLPSTTSPSESLALTETTIPSPTQTISTQFETTTKSAVCTVDVARENSKCPVASCAISETLKASCSTGSIELFEEIDADQSECCLKLCNYQCVDDSGKSVLSEGDVCCDLESNPDCQSRCDEGLKCSSLPESTEPTCMVDLDQIETVTWTMHGPWDIKSIQDESPSLTSVFSRTLGISPFSTALSVTRFQGIVQIAFTTTAPLGLLKPLKDPMFRPRFQANIIQANPDLASAMFLNTNEVQAMYVLEGPWSISAVQDFEEDLKSQFAFALQMNPDQIEEEITTQNKVVQVIYKCKGTQRDIAPLYDATAFTERFRNQIVHTNPGLSQVVGWAMCPVAQPLMGAKCAGRMTCEYGQECCCGECYPSMIFMCDEGKWEAMFSEACMMPNCLESAEPKEFGESKPGILRSSKTDPSTSTSSSKPVYLHLILLAFFGSVLGVFLGLMCHRCKNAKSSQNDLTKDLTRYQDISLDTQDLARSV